MEESENIKDEAVECLNDCTGAIDTFGEVRITGCSMGCLYADGPIDECHCGCMGETHGLMSGKLIQPVKCSPAAEKRCKEGITAEEDCECRCNGRNHGLLTLVDMDKVRITDYTSWDA